MPRLRPLHDCAMPRVNMPARYVTGHLPDIGHVDPGSPMDFHAYSEVYLGGQWHCLRRSL